MDNMNTATANPTCYCSSLSVGRCDFCTGIRPDPALAAPIKFNKHHVTNGTIKARVFYSLDNRTDGRACVTLYAKDYSGELGVILAGSYVNDTDSQTDYFDTGRAVLFTGHPLYAAARARAEQLKGGR